MACTAFEITADDIETVLQSYALRVVNPRGKSFTEIAEELIGEIDLERIEKAALRDSCDLDEQTGAAHEEIKDALCEMGVLEF